MYTLRPLWSIAFFALLLCCFCIAKIAMDTKEFKRYSKTVSKKMDIISPADERYRLPYPWEKKGNDQNDREKKYFL